MTTTGPAKYYVHPFKRATVQYGPLEVTLWRWARWVKS